MNKLKFTKQAIGWIVLVILFVFPLFTKAQSTTISETDKSKIKYKILKKYNFHKDSSDSNSKMKNIYILKSDSVIPITKKKGFNFLFITKDELDNLGKDVADYYEFNNLQIIGKTVFINFSRFYLHPVNGDGTVTKYSCKKISDNWKIKMISEMEFADNPQK